MTEPKLLVIFRKVMDKDGNFLAFEFDINGETFFYAKNQARWEGLRVGSFPRRWNLEEGVYDLPRETLVLFESILSEEPA